MPTRRPRKHRLKYLGASVMPGDHGLRPDDDKTHIGLLELTDHLRWVPERGEGWRVPIRLVDVESPPLSWRELGAGILLALPDVGRVRVFGRAGGGVLAFATQGGGSLSPRTSADIRRELLARGAADTSGATHTELG